MAARESHSDERLTLPKELQELLDSCDTACVWECCELDAFVFSEENFRSWFCSHPGLQGAVREQLDQVLRAVEQQEKVWVSSDKFSLEWSRERALALFRDILKTLETVT